MPSVTIERTITNRMPRGFPTGPCARAEAAGRGGCATASGRAGSAKPGVVGSSGVSLTRTTSVVGTTWPRGRGLPAAMDWASDPNWLDAVTTGGLIPSREVVDDRLFDAGSTRWSAPAPWYV